MDGLEKGELDSPGANVVERPDVGEPGLEPGDVNHTGEVNSPVGSILRP
jgi:hypothetical protein